MQRNLRDSYKHYKKETKDPVDIKIYLEIVAGYNKYMVDRVLEGDEVTLPARFGTLSIMSLIQNH